MKKESIINQQKSSCIQPPLDYPWLLFKEAQGKSGYICCTTSSLYKGFSTSFPDSLSIKRVFNCCYGWLICAANSENELFLWNPVLSKLISLPPLEMNEDQWICGATLSSPGNLTDDLDPNCAVLLFMSYMNCLKPRFYCINYCILGENYWNLEFYGPALQEHHLENSIISNGTVYVEGTSLNGNILCCIDDVTPTRFVIDGYCRLPDKDGAHGYLVESCGEVFYIVITWRIGPSKERFSHLETFKLDKVSKTWNKVRDVGDRVLFLNERYSITSHAPTEEKKGGFLYYVSSCGLYLSSYCFAENSVLTSLLHPLWNLPTSFDKPICYLPDRRFVGGMKVVEMGQYEVDGRKNREETDNGNVNGDEKNKGEMLLFCLPPDLIKFITRFLNPVDYLNFCSVSKLSRLLAPKIEWRKDPISLANGPSLSPWLVSSANDSGVYNFLDSNLGGKYLINTPKSLVDTKIIHSKNGWLLLMSNSLKTLSFYNPFTTEIVKLPRLVGPSDMRFSNMGFSSCPKSANCIVVAMVGGIDEIKLHVLRVGKKRWVAYIVDSHDDRLNLYWTYRPLFRDGDLYVLGKKGNLGLLKFQGAKPMLWEVLIAKEPHDFFYQNFLLECDGKLLAVSVDEGGETLNVFALNQTIMSWENVDNLGNYTLYLSRTLSFSCPARANWMKNKIFFPRLHNDKVMYYSMDTGKYYTLADKNVAVEYHNSRELLLSNWIQPSRS